MALTVIPVTGDFRDMDQVRSLNEEAFPEEERISTERLIRMAEKQWIDLMGIYDHDSFIGFTVIFKNNKCVYLFFIAVKSSLRSKGYGSRILELIHDIYPGHQLVLDIEPPDDQADNREQRLSRKRFYSRNGFKEAGYLLEFYRGIAFEVLFQGERFELAGFEELLDKIGGFTNEAGNKAFHPVFYKNTHGAFMR